MVVRGIIFPTVKLVDKEVSIWITLLNEENIKRCYVY